jgi:predicted nucleic acid-binding protein
VLRTVYKFAPLPLARALRGLAGLPTVTVQEPVHLRSALDWLEAGIDFADAFHLAAAHGCDAFVTFDGDLIKRAKGVSALPVRAP